MQRQETLSLLEDLREQAEDLLREEDTPIRETALRDIHTKRQRLIETL